MNEQKEIGKGYGGFPLFPIRPRRYRCVDCGTERVLSTNHHVACYPECTKCKQYIRVGRGAAEQELVLPKQTTHEYLGELDA